MRFSLALGFVTLALIVILCESKSVKKHSVNTKDNTVKKSSKSVNKNHPKSAGSSAKHETSKKTKVGEKKEKISKQQKAKTSKSANKDKSKTSKTLSKSKSKTEKKSFIPESSTSKENLKVIPKDCDDIVQEYANGKMVMYEYKVKMAKCLKEKGAKSSITSKYENDDSSNEDFFRKALKYTQDDEDENDDTYKDDDDDEQGKTIDAPNSDSRNSKTHTNLPKQQSASYSPISYQDNVEQPQVPVQRNAAFSQNTVYNPAPPAGQQNYNYYARNSIPATSQGQNANQWNTPYFAPARTELVSTKKSTLPAVPSNDPFAQFMNIQSSPDTAPQPIQQRSDIPSDQGTDELQAAQSYLMPANQQAYFRDQYRFWSPEDEGIFPENP